MFRFSGSCILLAPLPAPEIETQQNRSWELPQSPTSSTSHYFSTSHCLKKGMVHPQSALLHTCNGYICIGQLHLWSGLLPAEHKKKNKKQETTISTKNPTLRGIFPEPSVTSLQVISSLRTGEDKKRTLEGRALRATTMNGSNDMKKN